MDASPLMRIMAALEAGPGTASELAVELGISPGPCSSYLYRLWRRGWVDRADVEVRSAPVGRAGRLYGLKGAIPNPAPAPPPRPARTYSAACTYGRQAQDAQLSLDIEP